MSDNEEARVFLLIENPRKSNNLGPLLRCANAFGIDTIVAVGFSKCSVDGSHGASKNVEIIAFPTVDQAVAFLRDECECRSFVGLLGCLPGGYNNNGYNVVESKEGLAQALVNHGEDMLGRTLPVTTCPFRAGNLCLAVGKQVAGLPLNLARQCQSFVHVPHIALPAPSPTHLLDIQTCISITLHHFTQWAGYDERTYTGHKFAVKRPVARPKPKTKERTEVEVVTQVASLFDTDNADY